MFWHISTTELIDIRRFPRQQDQIIKLHLLLTNEPYIVNNHTWETKVDPFHFLEFWYIYCKYLLGGKYCKHINYVINTYINSWGWLCKVNLTYMLISNGISLWAWTFIISADMYAVISVKWTRVILNKNCDILLLQGPHIHTLKLVTLYKNLLPCEEDLGLKSFTWHLKLENMQPMSFCICSLNT